MILRTRHTGLVVRNLEKAKTFYEALGFVLISQQMETGSFIDQVVGIQDVNVETAKFKAPDGSMLELLQYHSHPLIKDFMKSPSNQLGCSHIAYTVEDIHTACNLIASLGGSIVNQPATSKDGKVKVAYCHDIDGILMEIVEEVVG